METPQWEFLVEVYGEIGAMRMLRAMEALFLAEFSMAKFEGTPQDRLNMIFGFLEALKEAA